MSEYEVNEMWARPGTYQLRACRAECDQGRCPCPCEHDCWQPATKKENAEFIFVCAVGCIGFLTVVGMAAGWFS